jgi:uncharacterized protein Yka (UPF0111/DUF47 family)
MAKKASATGIIGISVSTLKLLFGISAMKSLWENQELHVAMQRVRKKAPTTSTGVYANNTKRIISELELIEKQIDSIIEYSVDLLVNAEKDYSAMDEAVANVLSKIE